MCDTLQVGESCGRQVDELRSVFRTCVKNCQGKGEKYMKIFSIGMRLGILLGILIAAFYGTRFQYFYLKVGDESKLVRVNRWTDDTEALHSQAVYWKKLEPKDPYAGYQAQPVTSPDGTLHLDMCHAVPLPGHEHDLDKYKKENCK